MEALLVVATYATVSHLLTLARPDGDPPWPLLAGLLLIGTVFVLSYRREGRASARSVDLWIVLNALALGFWLFAALRYVGLARWPLATVGTLREQLVLLLSHVILVGVVFSPLLWIAAARAPLAALRWGGGSEGDLGAAARWALRIAACATWAWALSTALTTRVPAAEERAWFLTLAFLKAILNGGAEEVAHRGIVQSFSVRRFGAFTGIAVQAAIYTAFHVHLGAVFWDRWAFLLAVMLLGVLFGVVTRVTGGIGWALLVHVAIAWTIELHNLS